MQKSSFASCGIHAPECHEPVVRQAERVAQRPEVLLDQLGREAIVARRNRRMRGEDHLRGHAPARLGHVDALGFHAPCG